MKLENRVIATEKHPIKLWLSEVEENALEQAKNVANLPFLFKHVALMPDCHMGYGVPIGTVMATNGVVSPNAVGVDIGCGVVAIRTSITDIDTPTLKKIMGRIRKVIPVGFNHHQKPQDEDSMPSLEGFTSKYIVNSEFQNAILSLCSLGGGNYFIELQKDHVYGRIWIMIHSGSRNLGKKVADHYNNIAVELNEKWHSSVPKEWQLAFLPLSTEEGQMYLKEMQYCVDFAYANRKLMINRIVDIFNEEFKGNIAFGEMINIAHNYASIEHHFGHNVVVHRKGATQAKEGQIGIIPGSQGTSSYIVKGKGNPESFLSCSHGAGRLMGRKEAQRSLSLEDEIKKLNEKGVIHNIRNKEDLDEAPSSYKNIEEVMEQQKDLVEIVEKLEPLAVIKG